MKKVFLLMTIMVVSVLMITSCKIGDKFINSDHWILNYFQPDSLVFKSNSNMEFSVYCSKKGKLFSEKNNKDEYLSLCKKNNDMTCPQLCLPERISPATNSGRYLADNFKSVSVVSNKDFDIAHPAGTPLNDIIWFRGMSYLKFIDSKYDTSLLYSKMEINSPISTLGERDLYLLRELKGNRLEFGTFKFVASPINQGDHTLTVTFTTTDDKSYSSKITMILK